MFYTDCPISDCHWDEMFETAEGAVVATTCHVVVKHPDEYRAMTGKEPEQAKKTYEDEIHYFRRKI